ncbi:MAG: penicillin-binding protein 1C [Polyangiaceae bacterium]|nr:penicillin-binding protein 1C [Polyangiaceae bacterium]
MLAVALLPPLLLVITAVGTSLPPELVAAVPEQSLRVEDREGRLLREVRTQGGELLRWVPLSAMPELLPRAVVAVEDRRFHAHPGVDPAAVVRAAGQCVRHRRWVSGASTLTMQLARRLRPHPRNLRGKWGEMALALRIEFSVPKPRILEEYLNRVDFGPNVRGIGAASQAYFGKPVAALSLGEIALLVGLPQGPSVYSLGRHPERALARRARVLRALVRSGVVTVGEAQVAEAEALSLSTRRSAFGAPHLVSALVSGGLTDLQPALRGALASSPSRVRTTIDSGLQRAAEVALASVISGLSSHQVTSGAALVIDNVSGEILAYVGSPDFYDEAHQGQVDGVRALRQPGSTLKPFVYAAAIDELGYTPATVLPDLELRIPVAQGFYTPRNFDDRFRGPVRLREALGNSLNVPAVHTAVALGSATLLRRLHAIGFDSLRESPEYYGPALALGDGEVRLVELCRAYSVLARGGTLLPVRVVSEVELPQATGGRPFSRVVSLEAPAPARVLPPATAALITDILKDPTARAATFGLDSVLGFEFDVAAKTGTSKGYRDNWVVGYSHRVTVGVWVGNFDGSPMLKVGGTAGAAPVFRAVMEAAMEGRDARQLPLESRHPEDQPSALGLIRAEICPVSGEARGEDCPHGVFEWIPVGAALATCRWHHTVTVDRRNGLLAGRDCPSSMTARRRFEFYPPEYAEWARGTGHSLGPELYSPHCPGPELPTDPGVAPLRIITPTDGARYVIDPDRPLELQSLEITAVSERGSARVALEVDGVNAEDRGSPFQFEWRLAPGHHRFVAVDADGRRSPAVDIEVRR